MCIYLTNFNNIFEVYLYKKYLKYTVIIMIFSK